MKTQTMLVMVVAVFLLGSNLVLAKDSPKAETSSYTAHADETLSEIALRLYGRAAYFPKIARWNNLHAPYHLEAGMNLVLKEPPTLTMEEGNLKVLESCRKRLGIEAPQSTPVSVETLTREADGEEKKGKLPQASASYRKARELSPDNLTAWFSEISLEMKQGKTDDAKETARLLVEKRPEMKEVPLVRDLLKD